MIDKLEKKIGKYAIKGLMKYIIILYAAGFIINIINPNLYADYLMLDIDKLLEGQIWRIFTFIIQPVDMDNVFRVFLSLYVNFMFGMMLESIWGSFRFNLYYFSGIFFNALAIVAVYIFTDLVLGYGVSYPLELTYLNLTLFLAFAVTFPETRFGFGGNGISMFAIIYMMAVAVDVSRAFTYGALEGFVSLATNLVWVVLLWMGPKGKHLALAYVVLIGVEIILAFAQGGWIYGVVVLIAIAFSMLNFLIFFLSLRKKGFTRSNSLRRQFMRSSAPSGSHRPANHGGSQERGKIINIYRPSDNGPRHKCAVCGRTEKDDDSLEFRFCSKCNGSYEYCSDHLYTHSHVE